jgi:integrase
MTHQVVAGVYFSIRPYKMKMAKPTKHYNKWRIRWTDENNQRLSEVFDEYKTASFELKKRETTVLEVKSGAKLPTPFNKKFEDICEYWIKNRLPHKRSSKDDLSIINTHLIPFFQNLKLKEISVSKVDEYVNSRPNLSKKTISNHLTLLISLLRLAVDLNWLLKIPNIKKPKTHLFSHDFNFLRTDEEIQRFLTAAKEEDEVAFLMFATAIYTGMRAGELAALKFSNIKFDGPKSLITIQNSFDNLTKSGKVRYVPVLAPLYTLLMDWQKRCGGDIVFPNRDGQMYRESGRIFQEVFHRVLDRAGFPKIEKNKKIRRYIVFHDLRHTFASHWVMRGGDVFKLQHILGHSNMVMTMRYAHFAPHAFSGDFERLGSTQFQSFDNVISINSKNKI